MGGVHTNATTSSHAFINPTHKNPDKKKMETKTWQLKDPTISAKGAKSCALIKTPNDKVFFTLGSKTDPLRTPFGATSYNDEKATRKTIEFTLNPQQVETFKTFDSWAVDYLVKNSERIFKKKLGIQEVKGMYKSPVSQKGEYMPHLRCKINTSGLSPCRCWDENDERCELPEDLRTYDLVPRIQISHLWIMAKEVGFVMQINDLMVAAQPQISPFAE